MTTAEDEVLDLHVQWVAANRTADSSFLPKVIAPDIVMFNLIGANFLGLDNLTKFWDTAREVVHEKKGDSTVESLGATVTVSGDIAWLTDTLRYASDFTEMGMDPVSFHVRSTEIWQHFDHGWKMVHCHYSEHTPGKMGGV